MNDGRMLLVIVTLLCVVFSCQKKRDASVEEQAPQKAEQVQFVAPGDSVVSEERLRKWISCNPLLDSLSYLYEDSFKVDDPGTRLRLQIDFQKAQSLLCVRSGLRGGYDEYLWIRRSMGNPKNKSLLDSFGVAVY